MTMPILQMWKMIVRRKYLAQGHRAFGGRLTRPPQLQIPPHASPYLPERFV